MRRLGVLGLAALLFGACSSGGESSTTTNATTLRPTSTDVTQPLEQLQMKASAVTDLLIAKKWPQAVGQFNASMKASYTPDSLKLAWGQVEAKFGAYVSRGTTTRVKSTSNDITFDTPLTFKDAAGKSRISFDIQGQVSGLNILPASTP